MDLIISSNNKNKIKEINDLLSDLNINLLSLSDINFNLDIEETGTTFEENSYIKASTIESTYHKATIADDSGLCVEALNGAPGVYSHRFAGVECDDTKNNLKLVEVLKNEKKRNAKFVSVICYINNGVVKYAKGEISGVIIDTPRGNNGFGYDPYFFIPSLNKTMAELTLTEKNKISHRALALQALKEILYEDVYK